MSNDWSTATIEEVAEKVAMGPFGSSIKVETFVPEGIPIISGQHLHGTRVDDAPGFNFITEEHAKKLANANVYRGDVVFTHAGNIGQAAYIPEHSRFSRYVVSQRQFYLRCNRSRILPEFVALYFKSPDGQHQLLANSSQVGVPSIARPVTYLHTVEIPLPPLSEQRAIAHILGTLDDKIEVNRRMNETLEEMARSLFKSWFVDFDPVHAKVALNHRAPSHHSPLEGESARQGPGPAAAPVGGLSRLYSPRTLQRAKALRQNRTDAEGLLWHFLRNRQLDGYKFRRQQPIGPYIADFACLSEKLLIELDGGHHAERSSHDAARDRYLQDRGYKVLRFWNNDVFGNCLGVLERIQAALTVVPPPHQPSPDGSASATPPQGGSDGSKWSVERARDYLNRMDPKIANLFPDALDHKGKPMGWEYATVGERFNVTIGRTPPRKEAEHFTLGSKGVPWLSIRDMGDCGTFVSRTSEGLTTNAITRFRVPTVSTDTVVVSFKLTVGRVAIVNQPMATNEAIAHLNSSSQNSGPFFAYCWMKYFDYSSLSSTSSIATAVNSKSIKAMRFPNFGAETETAFETTVAPVFDLIRNNEQESCTLAQTRDTLLPKLISGEIRVAEAEKAVEAVT